MSFARCVRYSSWLACTLKEQGAQAVPRTTFQAGYTLTDLASQAGQLQHSHYVTCDARTPAAVLPLPDQPLLVTNALDGWSVPALSSSLWQQWGRRVVPVEVSSCGGDYRDHFLQRPGSQRRFQPGVPVTLAALLDNIAAHGARCAANGTAESGPQHKAHRTGRASAEESEVSSGAGPLPQRSETLPEPDKRLPGASASGEGAGPSVRLYLAQTDLTEALPDLAECVPGEPPFTEAAGRVYQRSVWLGPRGTVTPLHRDPYFNLLCQVEGVKHVRLYAPEHAQALLPYPAPVLRNTSQVRWISNPSLLDNGEGSGIWGFAANLWPGLLYRKYAVWQYRHTALQVCAVVACAHSTCPPELQYKE